MAQSSTCNSQFVGLRPPRQSKGGVDPRAPLRRTAELQTAFPNSGHSNRDRPQCERHTVERTKIGDAASGNTSTRRRSPNLSCPHPDFRALWRSCYLPPNTAFSIGRAVWAGLIVGWNWATLQLRVTTNHVFHPIARRIIRISRTNPSQVLKR